MTELQTKLLEMLVTFHKLCVDNGLRYYAVGGTALGAMRHHGFIPWDDDLDVGMPRADYEKLKRLTREINVGKYVFEFPGENKDFVYPFGKMYDTTTTLIENTRYKTKRGVFLDIFVLDGVGNTYEEALSRFRSLEQKVNLILTTTCAWRKGRKLYKNLATMAMRCIPQVILNTKKLMQQFESECQKMNYDSMTYVAQCCSPDYHEKMITRRDVFGRPTVAMFENVVIHVPEKADEFLTNIYGDWMQLPPKEKQVTHHDFILCDLNTSYLNEYIE